MLLLDFGEEQLRQSRRQDGQDGQDNSNCFSVGFLVPSASYPKPEDLNAKSENCRQDGQDGQDGQDNSNCLS